MRKDIQAINEAFEQSVQGKSSEYVMEGIFETLVEDLSDKTLDELVKFFQNNPVNANTFVKELFAIALEQKRYRNSGEDL